MTAMQHSSGDLLGMPCRNMDQEDADLAVCCAVPVDAPGITIVARVRPDVPVKRSSTAGLEAPSFPLLF